MKPDNQDKLINPDFPKIENPQSLKIEEILTSHSHPQEQVESHKLIEFLQNFDRSIIDDAVLAHLMNCGKIRRTSIMARLFMSLEVEERGF